MENINFKPVPDSLRAPMRKEALKLINQYYKKKEEQEDRSVVWGAFEDSIKRGMPGSLKNQPYSAGAEDQAMREYLDIVNQQHATLKDEITKIEQRLYLRPPADPHPLHKRKQEISAITNRHIGDQIAIAAYRKVPKPAPQPPPAHRSTHLSSAGGSSR